MTPSTQVDDTQWLEHVKFPVKYSSLGTYINDADGNSIADVRGWGWIQKLDNAEDIQDAIGRFIADAINEKAQPLAAINPNMEKK